MATQFDSPAECVVLQVAAVHRVALSSDVVGTSAFS